MIDPSEITYEAINFDGLERRANYRVIAYREDILHYLDRKEAAAILFQIIYRWQTEYKRAEVLKEIDRRKKAGHPPLTEEEAEEMMWVHMSYNDFVRESGQALGYNTVIRMIDYLVNTKLALEQRENHDPRYPDYEYRVNKGLVKIFLKALPIAPVFIPKGTKKPGASTQMGTGDERSTQVGTGYTQTGTTTTQMGRGLYPNGGTSQESTQYLTENTQEEGEGANAPMPPNVIDLTESAKQRAFKVAQGATNDIRPELQSLPASHRGDVANVDTRGYRQDDLRDHGLLPAQAVDSDSPNRPSGKHPVVNVEETFASQHIDPDETVKHGAIKIGDTNGHLSQPAHADVDDAAPERAVGDAEQETVDGHIAPIQQTIPTGSTDGADASSFPLLSEPRASGLTVTKPAASNVKQPPLNLREEGAPRPLSEQVLRARYEQGFWETIDAIRKERKLRAYTKTWKAEKDNQAGIDKFCKDGTSFEDIATGYKAAFDDQKDTWLARNFTTTAFYKRLPGLLDAKPGTNGKAPTPLPTTARRRNFSEEWEEEKRQARRGTA